MVIEQAYEDKGNMRGTINITLDNQQVIQQAQDRPEPTNTSETLVEDYDLWELMWELQEKISTPLEFEWIKGHQDETENKEKLYGPFPRKVQLNIEMDTYAKLGVKMNEKLTLKQPLYRQTIFGLYDKKKHLMTNMREYVYNKINGRKIKQYMEEKYGWNEEMIECIEWKSLEMAMKTYTEYKKSKIVQLIWDWQNVGRQKERIEQDNGQCPLHCNEYDTHAHYLVCKDERMEECRKKSKE